MERAKQAQFVKIGGRELGVNIIYIAVAAFLGGIIASILGWLDSKESFDVRKFAASAVRALVAAIVFAVGYSYANHVSAIDMAIAFCGGAGVDALGNRVSGSIKAGLGR